MVRTVSAGRSDMDLSTLAMARTAIPAEDLRAPYDQVIHLMQNMNRNGTTLVIGASGKTGARDGPGQARGAGSARLALDRPALRLAGRHHLGPGPRRRRRRLHHLLSRPGVPGAAETVDAFARLAVERGVRRLVLLSGRGEKTGCPEGGAHLQNSGADWTIVRCAFFNQNFNENFVDSIRHGVLGMPAGDTAEPFVDADDIADVVVAALTTSVTSGSSTS